MIRLLFADGYSTAIITVVPEGNIKIISSREVYLSCITAASGFPYLSLSCLVPDQHLLAA